MTKCQINVRERSLNRQALVQNMLYITCMINPTAEREPKLKIEHLAKNAQLIRLEGAHVSIIDGQVIPIAGLTFRNLTTGEIREPIVPTLPSSGDIFTEDF